MDDLVCGLRCIMILFVLLQFNTKISLEIHVYDFNTSMYIPDLRRNVVTLVRDTSERIDVYLIMVTSSIFDKYTT